MAVLQQEYGMFHWNSFYSRRTVLLRPKRYVRKVSCRRTVDFHPYKNQLQAYGVLAGRRRTDTGQNFQNLILPPRRRRVLLLSVLD